MKKYFSLLFGVLFVIILSGCKQTVPIQDVQTSISGNYTLAQVKHVIMQSGLKRRWVFKEVSNGVLEGQLNNRQHTVQIKITYSTKQYTMEYVNSIGMAANNGQIHRNYNRWIHALNSDIQYNLAALSMNSSK